MDDRDLFGLRKNKTADSAQPRNWSIIVTRPCSLFFSCATQRRWSYFHHSKSYREQVPRRSVSKIRLLPILVLQHLKKNITFTNNLYQTTAHRCGDIPGHDCLLRELWHILTHTYIHTYIEVYASTVFEHL